MADIDWEKLKHNHDIRAVCFDKDNTLTKPYGQFLHGSVKVFLV